MTIKKNDVFFKFANGKPLLCKSAVTDLDLLRSETNAYLKALLKKIETLELSSATEEKINTNSVRDIYW